MALYPIPFDELPSHYSFGKILLDIQIDHPSKSYQFVYRTQDRKGHVIRDENDTSAYIGSYSGVGFRSGISQFHSQWDIDVLLGETMTYDSYCQQNSVLRNPTSLTVLLDTKYDSKPVWEYTSSSTNNTNFCISNDSVPDFEHDDDIVTILLFEEAVLQVFLGCKHDWEANHEGYLH